MFIINDKHHEKIINELNSRRKKQLLEWYGEIHPESAIEDEMRKFKWLLDNDIINQQEFEQKIAQVKLLKTATIEQPVKWLN